ncbi:glycosyltransferase [Rhizobium sp. L1K21]|uniref:CgeB family protein n=1 Tax=Rhizobium sp. L1K21 TaxID=2954933 RepID=UPI0020935216|nr:glycosyltransferase [Rhizobium sp. L1K21]MCO6187812.1 glycosyltransferase [Rhizobium sp. L1K21]
MQFVFYTHSLVSDWNHGNAHFLRGVMRELETAGHSAVALEAHENWSRDNLIAQHGPQAAADFHRNFPDLKSGIYGEDADHHALLEEADVVIVHEWNDPALVKMLGEYRKSGADFTLLFHDTHHRAISAGSEIAELDLSHYDGILAFGETLRQRYRAMGWEKPVFTWHEAADTALFKPQPDISKDKDLVWIGNWGDDERSAELNTFLISPARELGLSGTVHGVRYPDAARAEIMKAGLDFEGWLANYNVPAVFAQHRATVHIPRRPYVRALPGIPTIRVFEALACGIPLVCAPWNDAEGLFRSGRDYLHAENGSEMKAQLDRILHEPDLAEDLASAGLETIRDRHTCTHRVGELLDIVDQMRTGSSAQPKLRKEAAQ